MQLIERERRNYRAAILAAIGLLFLIGVPVLAFRSGSANSVSGRVTCGSKTVVMGTVVAMADDGSAHTSAIDAQGRYAITGLPAGRIRLGVISRDPVKHQLKQTKMIAKTDRLTEADRGQMSGGQGWFAIPVKYEDPFNAGLEVTINGERSFNIEMP